MASTMFPKLFERGKIGRIEIANRIVKAPTALMLAHVDGSVSDRQIKYYGQIARGGAGLVFVDDGAVTMEGHAGIGVGSDAFIPGLSLLTSTIADLGAKSALQLAHPGRDAGFVGGAHAKSASRIQWEQWYQWGASVPQELTIEEIHELVGLFGDAARRGQQAGFDLIEVHGANGVLVNNFLSPFSNRRNDMYGGSLYNRMRFLIEIVRDIKKKTGGHPLSVRLSMIDYEPGGMVLEESLEVAKALEQNGVDVIHVTGGTHAEGMRCASPMLLPLGIHVPAAAELKKAVRIPVIVCGSITTPELAEEILENGKADFIAMARPLFADPEWPKKAKEGRPEDIRPCIRCNDGCHDRGFLRGNVLPCTVNPALFKEDILGMTPAERPKNVAVVGGGPAGMEAARVCALRGHKVSLYEKRKLGGALIEASVPDFKSDISRLTSYYEAQLKKLQVNVVEQEASAATIKDGKFDVVVVAVGAALKKPNVPGIDNLIVTNVLDVLSGKAKLGQRVLVIGGGVSGSEVGLFLAEQGKEVTFVEMLDQFMIGLGFNRPAYEERMAAQKITVHTGTRLETVLDKGAVVIDKNFNRQEIPVDNIVLASGFLPQISLKQGLENDTDLEVYAIGDCVAPRMIFDAVHEGYLTAIRI